MIASASLTAQFLDYPLRKVAVITSDFGDRPSPLKNGSNFHTGTDFVVKIGSAVISVSDGIVMSCYAAPGGRFKGDVVFGGLIVIKSYYHDLPIYLLYGHLSNVFVREGISIKQGELIGLSGNTGESTGPHLHFEILLNPTEILSYYINRK